MAKASRHKPWVVELRIAPEEKWYSWDAYSSEDEARMQAELARKRLSDDRAGVRYRLGFEGGA